MNHFEELKRSKMEKTTQYFDKQFLINRSWIFIALPKFYATHQNYEILSKSLVPSVGGGEEQHGLALGEHQLSRRRLIAQLSVQLQPAKQLALSDSKQCRNFKQNSKVKEKTITFTGDKDKQCFGSILI